MKTLPRRFLGIVTGLFVMLALTAASAPLHAEPVTIRFYYRSDGGARPETVQAWIEEFERQHPNIRIAYDGAGGMNDALAVSLAAGTGPDVIEIYGAMGQDLSHAGAFLDLRPFVARDFTHDDIADFFPALWDASILKVGPLAGSQMSIPRYTTTTVYYYNSDLFNAAGLANPAQLAQAGNWTWDTLRDAARRLTIIDGQGEVAQRGLTIQSISGDRFIQWLQAAGGDMFDPQDPTRFMGDEPEAVMAANFLRDLIWNDGSTTVGERDLFSQGRVAMLDEGMHALFERFERQIAGGFEWNIARRPVGPGGEAAYVSYDAFAIAANTNHPEEAWQFLKFLVSKEGQEINIRHQGLPPSRRSATPAYFELSAERNLHAFIENAMVATTPFSTRLVGDILGITNAMNSAITASIRNNEKSYLQAIQEVKPIIESIVAEGL